MIKFHCVQTGGNKRENWKGGCALDTLSPTVRTKGFVRLLIMNGEGKRAKQNVCNQVTDTSGEILSTLVQCGGVDKWHNGNKLA